MAEALADLPGFHRLLQLQPPRLAEGQLAVLFVLLGHRYPRSASAAGSLRNPASRAASSFNFVASPPGASTTCTACSRPKAAPSSAARRSEEHTSELQSLMRISYAVFCLKKKKQTKTQKLNLYDTKQMK